jgi:uncharacterized protein YjbI with pentapeptide repeats
MVDLAGCPWPGPRHYEEHEKERFLGRAPQVYELLRRIEQQQLSVLVALSGTGKTSLLYAGLLPALDHVGEQRSDGEPALAVRQWAALGESSPVALIARGIEKSVLDRRRGARPGTRLQGRLDRLAGVPPPAAADLAGPPNDALQALLDYVHGLCSATGGLVVILDQVEELLGSGLSGPDLGVEQQVSKILGALFQGERRLRLVLSLREEYLGRLSRLRREVAGLDARLFRLEPMRPSTARQVLLQTAMTRGSEVSFGDESAVETILRWLGDDGAPASGHESPVDLLRLQALLVGLYLNERERNRGFPIVIDDQALARFRQAVEARLGRQLGPGELTRQALKDHLERELAAAEVAEPPGGPGRELLRRSLVRMVPLLSSPGGLKRHAATEELIYSALREDLTALGARDEALRADLLAARGEPAGGGWLESAGEEGLAGLARIHNWNLEETAGMLQRSAVEVLDWLSSRGVLKATRGSRTPTYELVHDGFGLPLFDWAVRDREGLRDMLAAIVAQQGKHVRWGKAEDCTLREVRWLGCNLDDLVFRGVRFKDSVLDGTIFTGCTFAGCTFESCGLRGVVFGGGFSKAASACIFESCTFERCDMRAAVFRGGSLDKVVLRSCEANAALFVSSAWRGPVRLRSSILDNAAFVKLRLAGELAIEDCSLQFSQIGEFAPLEGDEARFAVRDSDLRNARVEEDRIKPQGGNTEGLLRQPAVRDRPRRGHLGRHLRPSDS